MRGKIELPVLPVTAALPALQDALALLIAQGGGSGCLVDYCDIKPPVTVWRRRSWREIPNE